MNQPPKNRRRKLRNFGALLAAVCLLGVIFVWTIGGTFITPANRPIGNPPAGLPVEKVEFSSASGTIIHGWFIAGHPGRGAVILMHGVHANRQAMVPQARFLARAGYAVLLFDFQAHGESPGREITFGYLESRDATAAVNFIHQKLPGEKVAVIGVSMGAAAALLAQPPLPVSAMVLECCYPTIYQATEDRMEMRFGFFGRLLTPLLMCQLHPRLGVSLDDLKPIVAAGKVTVPKYFMAGTEDRDTTPAEARALFDAAAAPKQFWLVPGAAHVDLHQFAKAEYEKRVLAFLAANLR